MEIPTTAGELLETRARATPDAIAIRSASTEVTFAQLDDRADRTAAGLQSLGLGAGSHVAVVMRNGVTMAEVVFGLAKIGAVCVPVNPGLVDAQIIRAIADSGATAVIGEHDRLDELSSALPPGGLSPSPIWIDAGTALPRLQRDFGNQPARPAIGGGDPLMIIYTSGTTGPPKGVVCRHAQLMWAVAGNADRWFRLTPSDVFYVTMPMFHVGALWYQLGACIRAGATAYLAERFSAGRFWAEVRECGATATMMIMSMATILGNLEPTEDERSNGLRVIGVAPLPKDAPGFAARYGVEIWTHYGMTEITPATVAHLDEITAHPGTTGRPVPEWDVVIADDDGSPVEAGIAGEIVVSPQQPDLLFAGYHGVRNADAVLTREIGDRLYFRTGDRGYLDADGFMYFVDRENEAIRRRGENISSHDVEQALVADDAIEEAAAVPVPSPLGEHDVGVFVVAAPGATLTGDGVRAIAGRSLPDFMLPTHVAIVEELPHSATHKIQKSRLMEDVRAGTVEWAPMGPAARH